MLEQRDGTSTGFGFRKGECDPSAHGAYLVQRALLAATVSFLLLATLYLPFLPDPRFGWSLGLVFGQDLTASIFIGVALAITAYVLRMRVSLPVMPRTFRHALLAVYLAVFALTGGGAVWLLDGFPFSHDEFLLVQEARVFLSGHLAAVIPTEWRPFIDALQPFYVRVSEDESLLSTGYFPGSAALYAAFETFGGGPLEGPILAVGCVVLTAQIARQIFPDQNHLALPAALLLAVSPQFLVTAMTPYAMTAHLFLNLAWLALFLHGTRLAHTGAIIIGALAIAQHQIHVHVLFALPFLADLALRRRKLGLSLAYAAVYALVFVGCLEWRNFVLGGPALNPSIDRTELSGIDALLARISTSFFEARSLAEPIFWLAYLLRFASWQNPVAIVLVLIGLATVRRAPRPIRLLTISIPVSLLPYILLVNQQGVGWGFRYLHVHLGTMSLLAIWAVTELRRRIRDVGEWRQLRTAVIVLGAFTAPVLITWRMLDFTSVVLPYRDLEARLQATGQDVLITTHWQLVENDFGFEKSPKILLAYALDSADYAMLCQRWRVGVVSPQMLISRGIGKFEPNMRPERAERDYRQMLRLIEEAGCG